jgi:arylsulfatase
MPTLAEVANVEPPKQIDGISFASTLFDRPHEQKPHAYLYWEFAGYGGQQALRMGDWKAVRQKMLVRNNPNPLKIELYNLADDIGESRDVSAERPEIVARMRQIMEAEHTPSEVFPLRPIDR